MGFVFGLEMVVLLGVALVACGALARRYPIAPAILLNRHGFDAAFF